jgi:hypothetical protein
VEPIDAGSWLRIPAVAVSVPLVVELDKLVRRPGAGNQHRPAVDYPYMRPSWTIRRAVAGLAVAALVGSGLAGCGDGDGDGDPATPAPTTGGPAATGGAPTLTPTRSAPATPEPDALFEFEIVDGRASPPLDRAPVARGSTVRIEVTSDQADEVHLHGYDLTADVGPGGAGVIEFTADQTGLFELETHEGGLVLLQLVVED